METNYDGVPKINQDERKFSEEELDIHEKMRTYLKISKNGIRYGDKITITNKDEYDNIKDEINLLLEENQILEIKNGNFIQKYDILLQDIESGTGLNLKNIQCKKSLPDGRIIQNNIYNTIKKETGIDLEELNDNLKGRGVEPLRFEDGGSIVRNKKTNNNEVIPRKKKSIFCKNGITYSLQIEGDIPSSEDYELKRIFHRHTGRGKSILTPSAQDLLTILSLRVPSAIFADNENGELIGKEYKIKKDINFEKSQTEIENIKNSEEQYLSSNNWKNYRNQCNDAVNKYFNVQEI